MGRLPEFLIIGAMKAGSTTLFRWLEHQPEIAPASDKEPRFFSDERAWAKGWPWYQGLFPERPASTLAGEASVEYTHPDLAETAADRIARHLPSVRLVMMVRHPLDRMASHYRHQVQRSRETRPFLEAISQPGNEYAARSRYSACLEPYRRRFNRENLLVVPLEGLSDQGWKAVLTHLGLEDRPAPVERHNVTETKQQYTKPMLWLFERGITGAARLVPRPVRAVGKRLLTRQSSGYQTLLDSSRDQVPPAVADPLWDDAARLAEWLGADLPWKG